MSPETWLFLGSGSHYLASLMCPHDGNPWSCLCDKHQCKSTNYSSSRIRFGLDLFAFCCLSKITVDHHHKITVQTTLQVQLKAGQRLLSTTNPGSSIVVTRVLRTGAADKQKQLKARHRDPVPVKQLRLRHRDPVQDTEYVFKGGWILWDFLNLFLEFGFN